MTNDKVGGGGFYNVYRAKSLIILYGLTMLQRGQSLRIRAPWACARLLLGTPDRTLTAPAELSKDTTRETPH